MIVDGKALAASILERLRRKIKYYSSSGDKIKLVSLNFKGSSAYLLYQRSQRKTADYLGVDFQTFHYRNLTSKKVGKIVEELNDSPHVHGIVIELPLPPKIKFELISGLLDYRKDVEGVSVVNQGLLSLGRPFLVSPTALACFHILKTLSPQLYGKNVTIVGASSLVGKPLAQLLLKEMATVSVTHIATFENGNLPKYTRQADILISAAGKQELITKDMVKKDAVVLDVGINHRRGRIVGDVSEEVRRKCRYITPVPGGVGPVTTAFLFSNLLKAFLNQKGISNVKR